MAVEQGSAGGMPPTAEDVPRTYAGTFIISLATLALEILLTRLLSVVTWYHVAFLAISTAMLGMTAGALRVFVGRDSLERDGLPAGLSKACRGFAIAVPLVLLQLCSVPLQAGGSATSVLVILAATAAMAVPFYFSGIAIAMALSRSRAPVSRVYGADLIGAALGCLFVLFGLEVLDVPSLVLLTAAGGAAAALAYAPRSAPGRRRDALLAAMLTLCAVANGSSHRGIQPIVVKGRIEDPRSFIFQDWNSYSLVTVYRPAMAPPAYWAESPLATQVPRKQFPMSIDGLAGTTAGPFASMSDIEYLRWDVTNVAYYLRPGGGAAVIGVGGGRDVQAAILFGHERVDGIELNPAFVSLLKGPLRSFVGLADRPGVRLHADEARSFLSRSPDRYRVIQMSLIDTWAATGAGAYSLSENALYTVEAWKTFLSRLEADGVFTVTRWYDPTDLGETGRIVSLAVASLLETGVESPDRHVALVTRDRASTLVLSRRPLSDSDLATLRGVAERLQYEIIVLPGQAARHPVLREILKAKSRAQLTNAGLSRELDFRPPTDDRPFFFNMLPLRRALVSIVKDGFDAGGRGDSAEGGGVVAGNLVATKTLAVLILSLAVLVAVTLIVPLAVRRPATGGDRVDPWGACYFSLLGAGFMFAEIGLIQRLSVLLGHPVFALGVTLFTIIASTGIGSFLSGRITLARRALVLALPASAAAALACIPSLLQWAAGAFQQAGPFTKIPAVVAMLFPLGLVLGTFFPVGMRLARQTGDGPAPWYWALNGGFGVLASALAVSVAIQSGISTNMYVSAACYALAAPCLYSLLRTADLRAGGGAR